MSLPILETKLFIPRPGTNLIPRPRLINRLNAGLHSKLTLVSAPPGFGKTTLVSDWLANSDRPVAWLSLDASDNDLTHFFTYLISAIQKISPDFGQELIEALHSANPTPPASLAISLLNGLMKLPAPSILVLDDYHLIENADILELLTFLLEHLPPTLHLVITTRHEPDFPLPRLRARGQLTELRTADLRFTPAETAAFLNHRMQLNLSAEELDKLEQRTEGWVAGLQLAALSLRNKSEREAYIETFSGSHHFVADYLVAEVLRTRPESIRQFLLTTSLLNRLNGELCDALTGRADGRETLATLERDNLFLIPLDETRTWYRYHHLFAELLRTQLSQHEANQIEALHLQASEWFEAHGFLAEAIDHATQSQQPGRVATLVETSWPTLRQIYNDDTLIAWLKDVPEPLFKEYPLLNVHYAFALMSPDPLNAEKRLNDIEAWLNADQRSPEELEQAHNQSIPGMIALARAYQAGAVGNLPDTLKYTQQALERLPEEDFFGRGSAGAMLGLTYWAQGDLLTAYSVVEQSVGNMGRSNNISAAISVMFILADICLAQLKLRQAEKICREAMALVADSGGKSHQGSANIQVILSEIHYERGELEQAKTALQTSRSLGEHAGLEVMRHRWYIAMAHLNLAEGDAENALSNLDEGEAVYFPSPAPEIRPIDAVRTRFWVRQGNFLEAEAQFTVQQLIPRSEISHFDLYHMTTFAQFLSAQSDKEQTEVNGLLNRLATIAEKHNRTADLIDILVLQTLQTHLAEPLERAISLARPEGASQRFINQGASLLPYLRQLETSEQTGWFIQTIIAHIEGRPTHPPSPPQNIRLPVQPLIEPLSEREIEVLALMADGKTNQQIANQLFLTLNTIKVHSRNIYGKLDVHNRVQAVNQARTLGLLPPNTTFGV